MPDQQRYTLSDAQRILAQRKCQEHGHDWSIDEPAPTYADPHPLPTGVTCWRCQHHLDINPNPGTVHPRTIDPCPTCQRSIDHLTTDSRRGAFAHPCGHPVTITALPDRIELAPRRG